MINVEAARAPFRKYADFSGRSSRREFWSFTLAVTIALGGLIGLAFVAIGIADVASDVTAISVVFAAVAIVLILLYVVVVVGTLVPLLAASVRRLHDTDHSGFWLLVALVPFGVWVVLYFLATASNPLPNEWGPNPQTAGDDPIESTSHGTAMDGNQGGPVVGWVTPPRRGPESTLDRVVKAVAVAVVAIVIAAFVGGFVYGFLADPSVPVVLPLETPPTSLAAPGTIEFGTGGTECALTDKATTFPSAARVRAVAFLNRPMHEAEPWSLVVAGPYGTRELDGPPPPSDSDCYFNDDRFDRGLPVGHYIIEMHAGSEVLAKGELDITP